MGFTYNAYNLGLSSTPPTIHKLQRQSASKDHLGETTESLKPNMFASKKVGVPIIHQKSNGTLPTDPLGKVLELLDTQV